MTPMTKAQLKIKIRDVLTNEEDIQEGLMSLCIVPLLQSHGLTPPYDVPPELLEFFNSAMVEVYDEIKFN